MQVAGLIECVLDSRVLLTESEWQKNRGINKVNYIPSENRKCDRLIEGGCIITHVIISNSWNFSHKYHFL
jgi:hypothetical protein